VDGGTNEVESPVLAQALEALAHGARVVFGEEEEDGSGVVDVEGIEARRCGGHGQGEVEAEPGLSQFRCASQEADGGAAPQGLDEPTGLGVGLVEVACEAHRKGLVVHGWALRHISSMAASTMVSSRKGCSRSWAM
jgi:hypothetical protein